MKTRQKHHTNTHNETSPEQARRTPQGDENPLGGTTTHPTLFEPRKTAHSAPVYPILSFDVTGTPAPQGSKRAIPLKNKAGEFTGKVNVVESAGERVTTWRQDVQVAAMLTKATQKLGAFEGPVKVDVVFYLPRPKGHYGTGRNAMVLKPSAPHVPTTKPDGDKLLRSTLDALTSAGVYRDDSQVTDLHARKRYADGRLPGATISVSAVHVFEVEGDPIFV